MALINQINADMIRRISGSSSSSKSSSISSGINGLGTSASVGTVNVNVPAAMQKMANSFRDSFLRMETAVTQIGKADGYLTNLSGTVSDLLDLARRSADSETTDEERVRLNSEFQAKVSEFRKSISNADEFDYSTGTTTDYLDVGDLRTLLEEAGVDTSSATDVAQLFARLGNGDTALGYSPILSEDATVVNDDGSTTSAIAPAGTDPLNQSISGRAEATIAVNTLQKLSTDVSNDLSNIKKIGTELAAGRDFALAGYASAATLASNASIVDANDAASRLVSLIRHNSTDSNLSAHSNIDSDLASALLNPSSS